MEVIRREPNEDGPAVWKFIRDNSPPTISCEVDYCAYGKYFRVYAGKESIADVQKSFFPLMLGGRETVELVHHQYYQNIVNLIEQYEIKTGRTVQFVYWAEGSRKQRAA